MAERRAQLCTIVPHKTCEKSRHEKSQVEHNPHHVDRSYDGVGGRRSRSDAPQGREIEENSDYTLDFVE